MIAKPTERPGQAPPRSAHPRPESRLAGLLPRTAHRRPHCRHRRGDHLTCRTGLGRIPDLVRHRCAARDRDGLLHPPGRPDRSPLPPARAGRYLTLRLRGAGQPAPVRSYSLSSAPSAGTYRISVKHQPHGIASSYLTTRLRPGMLVEVAAPRGEFVLDAGTGPVLLISAGIGVTPVLSMLHELVARRSTREIWWLHGARGPQEHPLARTPCSLVCRTLTSTCSTAPPRSRNVAGLTPPAASLKTRWPRWTFQPTRPPTSAARRPSWTTCSTDSPRSVWTRATSTPSCSEQCLRSTPADQADPPVAPPALRPSRNQAAGDLRPQRHLRTVHHQPAHCARARRRLGDGLGGAQVR